MDSPGESVALNYGNYCFEPFGVETLGPWSPGAHSLYKEIAHKLFDSTRDQKAGYFFGQKISIAIQRGNAASLLGTFPSDSDADDFKYFEIHHDHHHEHHDHHDHGNGNHDHGDHHHHEPGMPFDFSYQVAEDGNDYSHNAISDGDITRGEYRVALPDGRTQIVKYTADWKNGFNAEVTYEGEARYPDQPAGGYGSGSASGNGYGSGSAAGNGYNSGSGSTGGQAYVPPSQGGGYQY
uniref:SFRICE_031586 n=1 Tax=Spodoptera frugiperda TaxID=7108 RepID=A0A2H1WWI8_SPOFR